MNNKHSPARYPQSRVALVGTPLHGLVKAGSLTLPNSTSVPYPQPDASAGPDLAGAAWSVERPGVPTVPLTPEQQAEATANGWQWRNKAMLSGGKRQVYGKELNGWIYIDSAGDRWLVTTTLDGATTDFVSALSGTVTLARFGDFGKPAESYTYPVSLASVGQDSAQPGPLQWFDADFSVVDITSAGLTLYAISPTGGNAALMINVSADELPSTYGRDLHHRYALGWLELAISGVGAAAGITLSVLRSRATTLQAAAAESETFDVVTATTVNTDFEVGAWSSSATLKYIMGLHWVAGAWSDIAVDVAWSDSGSAPSPGLSSNPAVRTVADQSSFTITIGAPGGSVQIAASGSSSYTDTAGEGYVTVAGSAESIFDGQEITKTRNTTIDPPIDYVVPARKGDVPQFNFNTGSANLQSELLQALQFFMQITVAGDVVSINHYIDTIRYSAQLYGFRHSYLRGADGPATATFSPAVSPSGLHGARQSLPHAPLTRYYGAWCPHTEQAVWLETQAVCWV